jgi:hypothetical protein
VEKGFFVCIVALVILSLILTGLLIATIFRSNSFSVRMLSGQIAPAGPSALSQATSVVAALWFLSLILSIASYLALKVIEQGSARKAHALDRPQPAPDEPAFKNSLPPESAPR